MTNLTDAQAAYIAAVAAYLATVPGGQASREARAALAIADYTLTLAYVNVENERLRADVGQWQRLAKVRNDQVHELINETMDLEAENERLRAEDAAWEEREAACCPEDVGFEDMIRYLRGDVARLRAALMSSLVSEGAGQRANLIRIHEVTAALVASAKDGEA